jgi:hypothetical protein
MKERIQVKHDIAANWAKAVNFIPLAGELIIYDGLIENGIYIEQPKLKIGDGIHKLADLPFILVENKQAKEEVKYEYKDEILELF